MNIEDIVNKTVRIHGTRNPFIIAKEKGIKILYEELGSINGYYNTVFRQKIIHINDCLSEEQKLLTASHELGHATIHPKLNTPFLREYTHLSVNKYEIEANRFAVLLMITEEDLLNFAREGYTISQMASIFGVCEELIRLRLSLMKK